jgi:hypothetical protein
LERETGEPERYKEILGKKIGTGRLFLSTEPIAGLLY